MKKIIIKRKEERSQLKERTRYLNPTKRIIRAHLKASQRKTFMFPVRKWLFLNKNWDKAVNRWLNKDSNFIFPARISETASRTGKWPHVNVVKIWELCLYAEATKNISLLTKVKICHWTEKRAGQLYSMSVCGCRGVQLYGHKFNSLSPGRKSNKKLQLLVWTSDVNESRTLRNMIGYNKESSTPTCMLKERRGRRHNQC